MRISDWSSDVCSSDLISSFDRLSPNHHPIDLLQNADILQRVAGNGAPIGRIAGRDPADLGFHVDQLRRLGGRRCYRRGGAHADHPGQLGAFLAVAPHPLPRRIVADPTLHPAVRASPAPPLPPCPRPSHHPRPPPPPLT